MHRTGCDMPGAPEVQQLLVQAEHFRAVARPDELHDQAREHVGAPQPAGCQVAIVQCCRLCCHEALMLPVPHHPCTAPLDIQGASLTTAEMDDSSSMT